MRKPRRYETSKGPSWRVRYRSATGTEKSETFFAEAEADEFAKILDALGPARAIAWLDDTERASGNGLMTVDDVWAKWFEWKSATKDGRPIRVRSTRTIEDYEGMYRRHIKPYFGSKPADMIGERDIQKWIDSLATKLEPKTIADHHALLHAAYLWAGQPGQGFVVGDPCANTELPKRRKKAAKGLKPVEWAILHAAARKVDADAADLLQFMVASQWRWSECVTVPVYAIDHWTQMEEVNGVLVEVSYTYVSMDRVLRREAKGQFVIVDEGKSDAAIRRPRIKGNAETMLLRRIAGKRPDDLIFTTKQGSRWNYTHFHQRFWTRPPNKKNDDAPRRRRILEVAKDMGLDRPDLTIHWTRHTGVGFLVLSGEPITSISRRVGHTSIKTTIDVYGRMIDDTSDQGLTRAAILMDAAPPELPAAPREEP